MAILPRPSTPTAAWRDLRAFLATRERHQLVFAALALAIPALIVAGFYHDAQPMPQPREMMFVDSWPSDRSDAQIIAQQKIDQAALHRAQAERRAEFQRLKKQLGMD